MQCFTLSWSRLCWCMSAQKLFCYHLPTWGRAGVKLGDAWYVANISIILDAPCLFLHQLLCDLFTLRGIFMHFMELTYWQDATMPVPVFCCFCVLEKLHRKYSRNWTKQRRKFLFFPTRDRVQSRDGGGPGGSHTTWWRTPLMSTHAFVLVDSVGPPSAEVCRAAASFP
jgi:hypothetical protein